MYRELPRLDPEEVTNAAGLVEWLENAGGDVTAEHSYGGGGVENVRFCPDSFGRFLNDGYFIRGDSLGVGSFYANFVLYGEPTEAGQPREVEDFVVDAAMVPKQESQSIPVAFVKDLLWFEGESLLDLQFAERFARLKVALEGNEGTPVHPQTPLVRLNEPVPIPSTGNVDDQVRKVKQQLRDAARKPYRDGIILRCSGEPGPVQLRLATFQLE